MELRIPVFILFDIKYGSLICCRNMILSTYFWSCVAEELKGGLFRELWSYEVFIVWNWMWEGVIWGVILFSFDKLLFFLFSFSN